MSMDGISHLGNASNTILLSGFTCISFVIFFIIILSKNLKVTTVQEGRQTVQKVGSGFSNKLNKIFELSILCNNSVSTFTPRIISDSAEEVAEPQTDALDIINVVGGGTLLVDRAVLIVLLFKSLIDVILMHCILLGCLLSLYSMSSSKLERGQKPNADGEHSRLKLDMQTNRWPRQANRYNGGLSGKASKWYMRTPAT
ncbi:hypothetical protein T4E_9064 [Trichinella pseudospiralis]|uniref:Uncharacterized protein n=1 Tax=Trichinella pseudospiralis TaxID=6337 RepID=A0A0V0Y4I1_TRIPS|nr:hypothetical protein T4E_9064 [Trichinella pseudospiralis]